MTVNPSVAAPYALANRKPTSLTAKKVRVFDVVMKSVSLLAGGVTVCLTLSLLLYILVKGLPQVDWAFLSTVPSTLQGTYGILPNIINTVYMIVLTLVVATPLGIGAAIYLNEYAKKGRLTKAIEFTTEALAGIPSIIYGLFGTMFFCNMMGMGYSIIAGALTLTIMVLPTIIRTTQEALRTVPQGYREGAAGLGATKWHMIRTILLPCCMNGIVTSVILSIGRIVGESAALIFTAGIATNLPKSILGHVANSGATLTVQLYQYAERGENNVSFGIAAILVLIVLGINLLTRLTVRAKKQ